MKIREHLTDRLIDNGLLQQQAEAVMDAVEADTANECMAGRWRDETTDYPDALIAILWLGVQDAALKWIDANRPKHWARPMFARAPSGKTEAEEMAARPQES